MMQVSSDGASPPRHKSPKRSVTWAVAGVVVAAVLAFFLSRWVSANFFATEVSIIEISMVSPAQAQIELTSAGRLVPHITSRARARIFGVATKVHVKQGDRVEAGDVLFEMEPTAKRSTEPTPEEKTVRAPIAGTVVSKPPRPGHEVGGLESGIDIADFSVLAVGTEIPEGLSLRVRLGSPCEIVVDAHPGKRFRGHIFEISPHVNKDNSTVRIKVSFADTPKDVAPGMTARVSILSKELDPQATQEPTKVIVPAAAIVDADGGKIVFVVEAGKVHRQTVTLGAPFGDGFELTSGPRAGTRVVKNPPAGLRDGQPVSQKLL